MRSVLVRTTKTLARSGLILAVLPVRAAAAPWIEAPRRTGASEQRLPHEASAWPQAPSSFTAVVEGR